MGEEVRVHFVCDGVCVSILCGVSVHVGLCVCMCVWSTTLLIVKGEIYSLRIFKRVLKAKPYKDWEEFKMFN